MLRLFGEKLRVLREHKNLSQSALGRLLNSTRGHINNLEIGRKMPSLHFVITLAGSAHISPDYLVRDTIPLATPETLSVYRRSMPLSLDHVGPNLRRLRSDRSLTQKALADLLGLRTQAYISLLEGGHKIPSIEILIDIADQFGVAIDTFLQENTA